MLADPRRRRHQDREAGGAGDDTRGTIYFAPALHAGKPRRAPTSWASTATRGSVTLDIAKPEGQEIALRLIAQSDILVENFKVGALAKYGSRL